MYDPYNPDRPPIPEDDPDAHAFMHTVDGKNGWPFWHDNGERPEVENPAWMEYLDFDETGKVDLNVSDPILLTALLGRADAQPAPAPLDSHQVGRDLEAADVEHEGDRAEQRPGRRQEHSPCDENP